MTQASATQPRQTTARTEKLRAIAEVFGHDVARKFQTDDGQGATDHAVDPARIAWHRSRLVQHLRQKADDEAPRDTTASTPSPDTGRRDEASTTLTRLRAAPKLEGLAGEHPALIAHILRVQTQSVRVTVLRDLPGATARQVMRRLR